MLYKNISIYIVAIKNIKFLKFLLLIYGNKYISLFYNKFSAVTIKSFSIDIFLSLINKQAQLPIKKC